MNNTIKHQHPFHMVDRSPWPLGASIAVFLRAVGIVCWFQGDGLFTVGFGLFSLAIVMVQ